MHPASCSSFEDCPSRAGWDGSSSRPLGSSAWRVDPFTASLDELDQPLVGFTGGDAARDLLLAHVEVHPARRGADVAEVGVGHLTGAVDDAAHDGNTHAWQMGGARLDAIGGAFQVEQRPSATRAGDVIGSAEASA